MTLQDKQSGFLRLKLAPSVKAGEFEGYGAVYGNVDAYGDLILPGAFASSLQDHRSKGTFPVMLWGHDQTRPIGRWLELREDSVGLYVKGRCNLETTAGKDADAHLRNGDVTGMSIGYRVPEGGSRWEGGVNLLSQIDLKEVSVVAMPANDRARVMTSKADLVDLLTKSGLPRAAAAKVAAGGFTALTQNDDDDEVRALVSAVKASTLNLRNA